MADPRIDTFAELPFARRIPDTVESANRRSASTDLGWPATIGSWPRALNATLTSVGAGGAPADAGSLRASTWRRVPARSNATGSFSFGIVTVPEAWAAAPY